MGDNFPCTECCVGTADCECECRHCRNNQAACCYIVQVEGLTDQDCEDCDDLNRKYFLLQESAGELGTGTGTDCNTQTDDSTGTGTGTCGVCTWTYRVTEQASCEEVELCGVENTLLTVTFTQDGEYVFTFTLGDMQWEWVASGTAALKPECCGNFMHIFGQLNPRRPAVYGQVMTLSTLGDQCVETGTAGSPEGVIATLSWTDADMCSFTPAICSDRLTGVWPCCIQVEFSGTPAFDVGADASSCLSCDCYDGTVINVASAVRFGECEWNTFSAPSDPPSEICSHWDMEIRLLEVGTGATGTGTDISGADYAIEITLLYLAGQGGGDPVIFKKFYEDPPEVATFIDEEIPYFSGGVPDGRECYWAGTGIGTFENAPSMLLTGIVGGTIEDCITGDLFGDCRYCHCKRKPDPDIKVTLSGVIAGCASCSGVDGTYILTNDPDDSDQCRWEVNVGVTCLFPLQLRLELDQNPTTRATRAEIRLRNPSSGLTQIRWVADITDPFKAVEECEDFGPISVAYDGINRSGCDSDGTAATIESV